MLNLKQALAEDIAEGVKIAFPRFAEASRGKSDMIIVKRTDDAEHGDYASPVALQLAKLVQGKPMEIVEAIVRHMPKKEYIGRLAAAEPGFLNIFISPGWMQARLDDVIEEENLCAGVEIGKGKSVNLEFISANPTGPLTLGNVRSAFTADTLGRVFEAVGYSVTREYYFNDAGEQVRKLGESVLRRILQAQPFDKAQGKGETIDFPKELYQGDYVAEVGATIAEEWREDEGRQITRADLDNPEVVTALGQRASAILMAQIKDTIARDLQVTFSSWVSEQQIRESGAADAVLAKLKDQGDAYEKEGALWFRATKYGDEKDKVLMKRNGEYAYIAPDLGYHQNKFERGFDLIFTFVGADHLDQVSKVRSAMQALGYDISKLHFPINQWFRLIRGGKPVKLSKRRGDIATPKDLIDEVGYDAARFFFLQHDLTSHMDFDLDLAKERSEKNPVYYVQYAYVRLQSILRRAKEEGVITSVGEVIELSSHAALTQTGEVALMKQIYRLPEVVTGVAQNYAVQQLTVYAYELAAAVHFFYKHVPVLSSDDTNITLHRLQLVLAARRVLGEVLDLLGISKPDVM